MPYTPTDWVDEVTPLNAANMDKLEAGVDAATDTAEAAQAAASSAQAAAAAAQATANAAIAKAIVDVKGDLLTGVGSNTVERFAVGTDAQVLLADSGQASGLRWATPQGYELGYAQNITFFSVTGTEAAPVDLITLPAITFDGGPVYFEFMAHGQPSATVGDRLGVNIWEATDLGRIAMCQTPTTAAIIVPLFGKLKLTPTAGLHTYRARAWRVTANANLFGNPPNPPIYLRVVKA